MASTLSNSRPGEAAAGSAQHGGLANFLDAAAKLFEEIGL